MPPSTNGAVILDGYGRGPDEAVADGWNSLAMRLAPDGSVTFEFDGTIIARGLVLFADQDSDPHSINNETRVIRWDRGANEGLITLLGYTGAGPEAVTGHLLAQAEGIGGVSNRPTAELRADIDGLGSTFAAILAELFSSVQGRLTARATNGDRAILGDRSVADTGDSMYTTLGGPLLTALPADAYDGEEIAVTVDTDGTVWRFKYNAGSASAHKWEFIGGAPMHTEVTTTEASANAAYVDLATVGPDVTNPFAGDYLVDHGALIFPNNANANDIAAQSFAVGGVAATDAKMASGGYIARAAGNPRISAMRRIQLNGLAANQLMRCKYKASGAQSANFGNRWISLTPIRCS